MNKMTAPFGSISAIERVLYKIVSRIFASVKVYLIEFAIRIINTAGRILKAPLANVLNSSLPDIPASKTEMIPAMRKTTATIIIV